MAAPGFADVFCEEGVFSADQSRRILEAARSYGLLPRLHSDELAPSGGAELAAEIGASSADHLATPSPRWDRGDGCRGGRRRSDRRDAPAVTTWFLMKDHHAPARAFIQAGVPVAIGTDFNPGTSPTPNLTLAMSFAVINLR
jgi:imidazolonepropionase